MEIREYSAGHEPVGLMITVRNKVETLLQTVASESQHLRLSSDLSVRSMVHGCPYSHAHYTWRRTDSFEICMSIKPVSLPDSHWLPYSSSGSITFLGLMFSS